MLALSTNLTLLFLSRIPVVFMACMLCAQGAMPQFVGEQTRAVALGRLSVSYGIGMLLGSSAGGILASHLGHAFVGYLAAGLSFAMTLVSLLYMPVTSRTPVSPSSGPTKGPSIDFGAALAMCRRPTVYPLALAVAIAGLGISINRSQFSVVLADHFHLNESQAERSTADQTSCQPSVLFCLMHANFFPTSTTGLTTSLGAVMALLSNTLLIAPLRSRFSEQQLLVGAVGAMGCCFLAMPQVTQFWTLLLLLVPISLASTLLYTISGSALSNSVGKEEAGTAVSISHSLRSATGLLAPSIGGHLLAHYGYASVGLASAALVFAAAAVLTQGSLPQPTHSKSKHT
ncbi:uncharacterized protein MONBRDRAFT_29844 [Monosiga brevicollis MX1]|uniref:Major facilitator superfamily (MFS) profile domain-containing protein n=1 Tax=Monosiga brevicollis TaxID=81824 RepID=A9VCA2_MONBE|nr:uncharacterized protein MONBRDRAFT_29844 [Monosiga brevicollis MX1]EDQ84825.1 predicted protein [Monosiga brevicollis MX1]|eukprot:XP_001750326.1 hypothetical protein [Monosiga brevicollis MX1]